MGLLLQRREVTIELADALKVLLLTLLLMEDHILFLGLMDSSLMRDLTRML